MKQKRKETNNKCCQKKHHHTSMNQCKLVNSSLHNCTHQLPWCSVSDLEEVLVPCKKAFQHQSSLSSSVQCSQHHVLLQSLRSCIHQSISVMVFVNAKYMWKWRNGMGKVKRTNLHIGDDEGSSVFTRTLPGFKSRWMIPCP